MDDRMDEQVGKDGFNVEVVGREPQQARMNEKLEKLRVRDRRMERALTIMQYISIILSFILSALTTAAMAYSIGTYLRTRNHVLPTGGTPWPNPTRLWPTYMVLVLSVITLLTNSIMLFIPCCSTKRAIVTGTTLDYINRAVIIAGIVGWAISTGLFKMANTGDDIWGWSCGTGSDAIQAEVSSFLKFGTLCTVNTGSWDTMIINTVGYVVTGTIYLIIAYRYKQRRRIKKLEQVTTSQP